MTPGFPFIDMDQLSSKREITSITKYGVKLRIYTYTPTVQPLVFRKG